MMLKFDIKDVLSPGIIIKTKFPNDDSGITNIIQSFNNDVIVIPLNNEYFRADILNEDSIAIEFADHERQYHIDCRILDMDIINTQTMSVKILKVSEYENDRKSDRYYISLGANISSPKVKAGSTAIVTNICISGIYFISKDLFNADEIVTIEILLPSNKILAFKGKIVRSDLWKYGYEHAVQLLENKQIEKNVQELINIIDSKIINLRTKINKKTSSFLNSKVLVIEPSTLIRTMVKNIMNNIGIAHITEAVDSAQAAKSIHEAIPDIVLLSYIICETEDYKILDMLYEQNPNVKVIIFSSTPKEKINKQFLSKYKVEYISKTSSYETLNNSIIEKIKSF